MDFGSLRKQAPELRVQHWIDGQGEQIEPLSLADLGQGPKVLYCFQDWCPGCHSTGFPTLRYLVDNLSAKGFGFAAIQTVFEGAQENTPDKLRVNQERYGLDIPFGHDVPTGTDRHPSVMEDYRTAGTPWFTVIDADGLIVHADFRLDVPRFMAALDLESVEFG